MKQPIATITNLAYGVAAYFAWPFSGPVAFALVLLMIGSSWYHWTQSDAGRDADHAGMYIVFGMMFGYAMGGNVTDYLLFGLPSLYMIMPLVSRRSWPKIDMRVAIGILFAPLLVAILVQHGILTTFFVVAVFVVILLMRDAVDKRFGRDSAHLSHEIIHGTWHPWTAAGIYWMITLL